MTGGRRKKKEEEGGGKRKKEEEAFVGKPYHAVRLLQLLHILRIISLQVKCFPAGQMFMPETQSTQCSIHPTTAESGGLYLAAFGRCVSMCSLQVVRLEIKRKNPDESRQSGCDGMTQWKVWRRRCTTPFLEWWWILSVAQTWFWLSFSSSKETNTFTNFSSNFCLKRIHLI